MACLKVGDIRRFAIFMNHFDGVVIYVNKKEGYYDVIDCNGSKRLVAMGNVVGKGSVSGEVRAKLLKIAQEYDAMVVANKLATQYKSEASSHYRVVKQLQSELGNVEINILE